MRVRRYRYIGPPELLAAVETGRLSLGLCLGLAIDAPSDLDTAAGADAEEPFTFVIDAAPTPRLRIAPRRSEHVACAGGGEVLSAGEITFTRSSNGGWAVTEVTNQSTGYAPEPDSWPAVAAALDRAGISRPDAFTHAFTFRRCPAPHCRQLNIVRDGEYVCTVCEAELPERWNADG